MISDNSLDRYSNGNIVSKLYLSASVSKGFCLRTYSLAQEINS